MNTNWVKPPEVEGPIAFEPSPCNLLESIRGAKKKEQRGVFLWGGVGVGWGGGGHY